MCLKWPPMARGAGAASPNGVIHQHHAISSQCTQFTVATYMFISFGVCISFSLYPLCEKYKICRPVCSNNLCVVACGAARCENSARAVKANWWFARFMDGILIGIYIYNGTCFFCCSNRIAFFCCCYVIYNICAIWSLYRSL